MPFIDANLSLHLLIGVSYTLACFEMIGTLKIIADSQTPTNCRMQSLILSAFGTCCTYSSSQLSSFEFHSVVPGAKTMTSGTLQVAWSDLVLQMDFMHPSMPLIDANLSLHLLTGL